MKYFAAAIGLLAVTSMATAQTVTQPATGTTYDTLLTFDEPGTPTGQITDTETWLGDFGITITPRAQIAFVDDFSSTGSMPGGLNGDGGNIGTGNSYAGNWGQIVNFGGPISSVSVQIWNSTPGLGSPFLGGFDVFLRDMNGNNVGVPFRLDPAWNDDGTAWIDIQTAGAAADIWEISFADTRSGPSADFVYMDNLSWSIIPAPGAFALLGLAGLARRRRRQA